MIKLYYKTGCDKCLICKNNLHRYNIQYEPINLSEKERVEERKRFRAMGINYLPVMELDNGKIVTDCSEESILDLIRFGDLNEKERNNKTSTN